MTRVVIAYRSVPAYRAEFYSRLRDSLRCDGIDLELVHGQPVGPDGRKKDAVTLPWATRRPNHEYKVLGKSLVWQPILMSVRSADLVIVEQASKLLVNYLLLGAQALGVGPKVALWGHGANLQPSTVSPLAEAFKRRYSRLPHWWFAYTEGSKDRVQALGYPSDKITVVQNAIDTTKLNREISSVTDANLATFRRSTSAVAGSTGLFLGSLYADKRLEFLLDCASEIRDRRPDFVLLVGGDGPERRTVERAARRYPHVRYLGRLDGLRKATALRAADVMLMPGLVGLCVLDAFAAEAPLVTSDVDCHSPEIEYLKDGDNGACVARVDDVQEYSATVLRILEDGKYAEKLRSGCRLAAKIYTNEEMVRRFREGILSALA